MSMITIKNRNSGIVTYRIPEMNVRRTFAAGETKQVSKEELRALSYQPGGQTLINNYFYINDPEIVKEFVGHVEPEYNLDEAGVKELILNGSLDEFKDCLDWAPAGVIALIKSLATSLPMRDTLKAEALRKSTGYDVLAVLENIKADRADNEVKEEPKVRRTAVAQEPTKARRTTPQYKVISENN